MASYPKRAKLLLLLEFFKNETDEQHPKTMTEILAYLQKNGIKVERKAVYADINMLRDLEYDIVKTTDRGTAYFLAERVLESAEVEICASAICAAKFLTPKKSSELLDKLGNLFSRSQAKLFRQRFEFARTIKTKNEEIYYNIDKIVTAQNNAKKISFLYVEYLPNKKQQFRKDGRRYIASPYSLMWFEDAYYALVNINKYNNLSHFRVDRMTKVDILDEPARNINEVSEYKNYIDFDEYHRSVFSMFGGEMHNVRIRFREELATAVYDRFGMDVEVSDIKDGWFTISARVRVSPGFLSWLTIFGNKAEILDPISLRAEMIEFVNSLYVVYNK